MHHSPKPRLEAGLTRDKILQNLQRIKDGGAEALRLLDVMPSSVEAQAQIKGIVRQLQDELRSEYDRLFPNRERRGMTVFELYVYSPSIELAWTQSGISDLNVEASPDRNWQKPLEVIVLHVGKHLT